MTQGSLDSNPLGVSTDDVEGTYMGGPVTYDGAPLMAGRKFIGNTAQKIIKLSDIYLLPCRSHRESLSLEEKVVSQEDNVRRWQAKEQ